MKYGIYTVETRGNGFTALIKRTTDGAECFMQGEDAGIFLDELEAYDAIKDERREEWTADYIDNYFLGIDGR